MQAGTDSKAAAAETPERAGDPCTVVIFGAAGDLTRRKLVPALLNLRGYGLLPRDFAVVGVARKEISDEAFREQLAKRSHEFAAGPVDEAAWAQFRERLYYVSGEFTDRAVYVKLAPLLKDIAGRHGTGGNVLFYLATPPQFFAQIVEQLGLAGLTREEGGAWRRVIVEKPFGRDLDSAKTLNEQLRAVLKESQIYRIDHYLGKETVQNLMVFRFANGLFEPVWNRRYVDHVEITVAETVGAEGRGSYYDTAGVVRDMMQNHMFQLLSLIAMEPPISFEGEAARNEKVKVLQAIRPMSPEEILKYAVRGQYGEGFMAGSKVPAYRAEPDVAPGSKTETFAAVELSVENWRWAGVPFFLRSGKRLARRSTQIVIQFRKPPLLLFPRAAVGEIEANRLIIQIQPEEGIKIAMKAKRSGPTIRLRDVELAFNYSDGGDEDHATGYERLLYDCMMGDSTLFHREDMVEAAWTVATPILDLWATLPARDFPNYAAGSWGPAAADALVARNGYAWTNPEK
ncbi:MAG TPA: glucose-6-phosphate dehydrogenase [Thermoanaerobaculia bacterium]|nr:glucose-6-phosphate dehydrogenase [Thermoanaerobaculia bacterium]